MTPTPSPGSPSAQASALLERYDLYDSDETTGRVILHDPAGLDRHERAIDAFVDDVGAQHPEWEVRGEPGALSEINAAGTIGYLDLTIADHRLDQSSAQAAADALRGLTPDSAGFEVLIDGDIATPAGGGPSEGIGVLVAALVLFVAFGSLMAMVVPVAVAIVGALTGVSALQLAAHVVDMSSAATPLAVMIAIGVGIDYALLVVTRYREELDAGASPKDAVATAYDTAGRSVAFAGVTVVLAVLGLLLMTMPLVSGIAVGSALAVLLTMLAALTLMPAILAVLGRAIDKISLPRRGRHAAPASGADGWIRWSHWVQRHRWLALVGSLVVLALLSLPTLSMRLGFDNASALPASFEQRQAHDLVEREFGPGHNAALVVAVDARGAARGLDERALSRLEKRISAVPGVASTGGAFASEDGEVGAIIVIPASAEDAPETVELVHNLRDETLPALSEDTGVQAEVTGTTAAEVDYADYTLDRLPVFVGVVLAVAFVLLLVVFRSILVPLKAVAANVLSIGAAFGALVAIVQWGWLERALGFERAMPITAWVPMMMMMAVVFGLSMDYEVFLLSRMKEAYDDTGDKSAAVTTGLAQTGRVITAAALIMISVFGGFVLGVHPIWPCSVWGWPCRCSSTPPWCGWCWCRRRWS